MLLLNFLEEVGLDCYSILDERLIEFTIVLVLDLFVLVVSHR